MRRISPGAARPTSSPRSGGATAEPELRIAITSNGPGEFAGWVRPLVAALARIAPGAEIVLFFVPDDYATGREADVARALFPGIRVVAPADYVRFALGRALPDAPERVQVVQYLGGDLLHAARVRARLGGAATTYKFARRRFARGLARAFAIDERNARELRDAGAPPDRVEIVGNLAIDGALAEAAGAFAAASDPPAAARERVRVPPGGVLFMPGTRRHEVANLVPFFLQTALRLRRVAPHVTVAFGISPFTADEEIARALARGGHPNVWGARGRLRRDGDALALSADGDDVAIPIVRDALHRASHAKFVVTIPGTKCIELAALGVPAIVVVPLNAPEVVTINGPLQYIDRLPKVGAFVKRAVVVGVDARFPLTAQPNIDAGEAVMPEMRGTLTPGRVADAIASYAADDAARATASARLRGLYAGHAGAAERMARALVDVARA